MSCLEIVNVLKYKSDKEKTAILSTPAIKDKLKKELLKEAAMGNAYYNFEIIIMFFFLIIYLIILIMMIYMKHLKSLVIRIFLIIIV